ncbi:MULTISPECIES: hypothetical protein [Gammaproteobacteria]|jgi:hypothetical protein|uniref:hypothetical protein n=1 Tax=Gammaproteobacteria TaxID=1236 RepID=UPI001BC7EAE9|nr:MULTISPECIES: hypothetical protein [Gammaproteobacteria]MCL1136953.1 hypothetical protein [Shewanella hafniensis]MDP2245675.1 hypothetical protein [Pseudomonas sp.]GIU39899.1 hypothetical protein TUM4637_42100 [Shewanella hafniensis]
MIYLVEHRDGETKVKENRIFLALPLGNGIQREFEPYGVAHGIASGTGGDVASFICRVIA